MTAIRIVNAKKSFDSVEALKGINLEVNRGEFFGLLGPNGAGKSTLIHALVGLCRLSDGHIAVHGFDVRNDYLKTRALIGFAPQDINLDRFFSIRQLLVYQGGFYGLSRAESRTRADEMLTRFKLTEKSEMPYYRLSGGMQKRLLVAKAMMGKPQVLILDEPTAGVDVEQRHELWSYLRGLNQGGTTIILTTHYIDEAEELCSRIGIIHLGLIREMGTPADLIERYCEKCVVATLSDPPDAGFASLLGLPVVVTGTRVEVASRQVGPVIESLTKALAAPGAPRIMDMRVERGSLEDVFLQVTGNRIGS